MTEYSYLTVPNDLKLPAEWLGPHITEPDEPDPVLFLLPSSCRTVCKSLASLNLRFLIHKKRDSKVSFPIRAAMRARCAENFTWQAVSLLHKFL